MLLERVSAIEYGKAMPDANIFCRPQFTELNRYKVRDVHYLLFHDTKTRLGITLGEDSDMLRSPFSAPFGGLCANGGQRIKYYDEAVCLLKDYGVSQQKDVDIALPPSIYNKVDIVKQLSSLSRYGSVRWMDVNCYFNLSHFDCYKEVMKTNARKNLACGMRNDYVFRHVASEDRDGVMAAYNVIKVNRKERGHALRMSLENVLDTIAIVPADFFLLSLDGVDVASAMVFDVTDDISQVIYWGNIQEYSHLRPMNVLAYRLFEYYHAANKRILDIGPSSVDGEPDYGLIDFKESVGCELDGKYHFVLCR